MPKWRGEAVASGFLLVAVLGFKRNIWTIRARHHEIEQDQIVEVLAVKLADHPSWT